MNSNFHPPDIKSVSYLSNGSTLNATVWLSDAYKNPSKNASAWSSSNMMEIPYYRASYMLAVDVHNSYDVIGPDYAIRYDWDATSHNWTKSIEETSPTGEERYVDIEPNYNLFKHTNSQNYIDMSLESLRLNYPDRYTLLLLATDYFYYNGKICQLSDATPKGQIPPPTFNFSTTPRTLRPKTGR